MRDSDQMVVLASYASASLDQIVSKFALKKHSNVEQAINNVRDLMGQMYRLNEETRTDGPCPQCSSHGVAGSEKGHEGGCAVYDRT